MTFRDRGSSSFQLMLLLLKSTNYKVLNTTMKTINQKEVAIIVYKSEPCITENTD